MIWLIEIRQREGSKWVWNPLPDWYFYEGGALEEIKELKKVNRGQKFRVKAYERQPDNGDAGQ